MLSNIDWSAFWQENGRTLHETLQTRLSEKEAEICCQLAFFHHFGATAVSEPNLGEVYCELAMQNLIEKGLVEITAAQSSESRVGSVRAYRLTEKITRETDCMIVGEPTIAEPVMALSCLS